MLAASLRGHDREIVRDPRVLRADDGVRTRDLHLGKVTRYQLRYVRVCSVSAAVMEEP